MGEKTEKTGEKTEKTSANYQLCVDVYFSFFKSIHGTYPIFSAIEGKCMMKIVKHFESQKLVPAFELCYIFTNWKKLDPWLQSNALDLKIMHSKLNVIISQIQANTKKKIDRSKLL